MLLPALIASRFDDTRVDRLEGGRMLKPFMMERLAIRQLELQDAPELAKISDIPAVSQWMAFMEGGFPLEKA
jgi:hypothetical protein